MQIVCDPSYEFAMRTPSAGEAAGVEKGLLALAVAQVLANALTHPRG